MNRRETALHLIRDTESGIRALVEAALAERHYEDVSYLASLASSLSGLTKTADSRDVLETQSTVSLSKVEQSASLLPTQEKQFAGSKPSKAPFRKVYPIFEREGDRLVKVGWSKKDRAAYEHRVPRNVVRIVAEALAAAMTEHPSLRMDQVLPIRDGNGAEVPSYQAYLVLAWLRDLGVIVRQGNDGYALAQGRSDLDDIDELWNHTTERGDGHAVQ